MLKSKNLSNKFLKFIKKNRLIIGIIFIFTCVLIVSALFIFVYQLINVEGNSMFPTLKNGQQIFINNVKKPQRNDVVVFKYKDKILIKRLVGIPGDKLEVTENSILINDELVANFTDLGFWKFNGVIPDGKFFALGDNINFSNDSRTFGFFDLNDIKGVWA
ncbi:signal peptidase I [Mesomycoplasma hyopneumoniae]|uniref:signal peptidase I n=1 Tax=Mesomycoplasma hyopneumoniae TaxID=2099 RepID=UPI0010847D21|nr:signal peptidase I [Mesomycoplasma hyopneumoniae]QBY87353.1 signal peptidase I [Mesomycoplasma hyopneumoniae]QLG43166.1 signal peptidase I [Mesomycoplasma hyopneumoniae]UIF67067.1 signal peptidase I [Mesomycoplasma hyopneumoniae]